MNEAKPIKWPGSKTCLLKHLLPLPEHTSYVEVFGGSLALFAAKPRSKVEVVNDINEDLVTFYRVTQYHPEALEKEMGHQLNSRQMLQDYLKQPGLTDVQRASRFWLRNMISFGAGGESFGVSHEPGNGGVQMKSEGQLAKMNALHKRLQGVSVERLSWEHCLKLYDRPAVLFFLDPPYVGGMQRPYAAWTSEDMATFAQRVKELKANWIVTVGDTPAMRELWAFGDQQPVQRARVITAKASQSFGELIVRKRAA